MPQVPVILDCDAGNEIDDQFAIAYALKSPEIKLLGLVAVHNTLKHGPNSVDRYYKEIKRIVRLADSNVPVYTGSRSPIDTKLCPENSDGVEFIINTALTSEKRIYVAAIGPCTDIVNACLIEPRIMKKCRFLWLGGFRNNSYVKRFGGFEFNFYADKQATKVLFGLNLHLTLLPAIGTADRLVMNCVPFMEELKKRNTPLTRYLAKLLKDRQKLFDANKIFSFAWKITPSLLKQYWIFWDLAAPAVLKKFAVTSRKSIPSPLIQKGKMHFPVKGSRKITLIESVDEFALLKQAKDNILR
jgi:inosine-uridine nucleoside N-ribohydrolase